MTLESGHSLDTLKPRLHFDCVFLKAEGVLTVTRLTNFKRLSMPYVKRCSKFMLENNGFKITPNVFCVPYFDADDRIEKLDELLMAARGADIYIQDQRLEAFLQGQIYTYNGVNRGEY